MREKHESVDPACDLTGDLTRNLGICPDRESIPPSFHPTEPHWPIHDFQFLRCVQITIVHLDPPSHPISDFIVEINGKNVTQVQ